MKQVQICVLLLSLLTTVTSNTSISDDTHKDLMQKLDKLEQEEKLAERAMQESTPHHASPDHELSRSLKKLSLNNQKK